MLPQEDSSTDGILRTRSDSRVTVTHCFAVVLPEKRLMQVGEQLLLDVEQHLQVGLGKNERATQTESAGPCPTQPCSTYLVVVVFFLPYESLHLVAAALLHSLRLC